MSFLTRGFVAYTDSAAEPAPVEEPAIETPSAPLEPEVPAPAEETAVVEPAVEEVPAGTLIDVAFDFVSYANAMLHS